ncbi:hypothetical protein BKD26_14865 [Streptomyces sp. CB03238]|nr:hypothetical protein BKD26_14865 [Streptomyces sp. CB03238]
MLCKDWSGGLSATQRDRVVRHLLVDKRREEGIQADPPESMFPRMAADVDRYCGTAPETLVSAAVSTMFIFGKDTYRQ